MTDFLKSLLESTDNDDNSSIDGNIQVEESVLPLSTLIESTFADFDTSMIQAAEVYEMACVVGGVKVVSEGAGASEASVLLESTVKDFFGKIAKIFKKIGEKIVEIWNMIIQKIKNIGKNSQKVYNKYRAAAKEKLKKANADGKNIPIPDSLKIINVDAGEEVFAGAVASLREKWLSDDMFKTFDGNEWSEDEFNKFTSNDYSLGAIFNEITEKSSAKTDATAEDLKNFVTSKYEVKTQEKYLNATHINIFTKVVDLAASEDVAGAGKLCKQIEKIAKKLEKKAEEFSKNAPDDDTAKKFFTAAQSMFSNSSNVAITIINTRASIIINAAQAYANYTKSVATGKAGSAGDEENTDSPESAEEPATDAVDYSVYFESCDVFEGDCGDCDDDEEDVEEGGCKKAATESMSISDIAQMLL